MYRFVHFLIFYWFYTSTWRKSASVTQPSISSLIPPYFLALHQLNQLITIISMAHRSCCAWANKIIEMCPSSCFLANHLYRNARRWVGRESKIHRGKIFECCSNIELKIKDATNNIYWLVPGVNTHDPCSESPPICQQGATCLNDTSSYTCVCAPGYTSTHCEIGG